MKQLILYGYFAFAVFVAAADPVELDFYVVPGCSVCKQVKTFTIPEVEARFGEDIRVNELSIDVEANYVRLAAIQEVAKADPEDRVSIVLNGVVYIGGLERIENDLISEIEKILVSGLSARTDVLPESDAGTVLESRVRRFTLAGILLAGLSDGVNPCAFAAAILMVSLMSSGGRARHLILLTGISFCLAVFLTYFLIGLGAFTALKTLASVPLADTVLKWTMVLFLAVLALISLRDALMYAKHGDADRILLQLPDHMKTRLRTMARDRIRSGGAVFGGFAAGVVVTLIESICTGQVYLPTLTHLARQGNDGRVLGYLVLYNLAFMVPLIIVFIAAFNGVSSAVLAGWSRKNVVPAKILLALFFAGMAWLTLIF